MLERDQGSSDKTQVLKLIRRTQGNVAGSLYAFETLVEQVKMEERKLTKRRSRRKGERLESRNLQKFLQCLVVPPRIGVDRQVSKLRRVDTGPEDVQCVRQGLGFEREGQ